MSIADASSLKNWELIADVGTWMVIVGVIGEGLELFGKFIEHKRPDSKVAKWLHRNGFAIETVLGSVFWMMVVLGLVLEQRGSHKSKQIEARESDRITGEAARAITEAGKANERAASIESNNLVLRSNVVALEFKLMETSNSVVRIDPQNLPITSVRANAVLFVRGTNVWGGIDPVKNNQFVTLNIGNRDWVQKESTFKLFLVCKSFETFGTSEDREWVLEFGPDPMPSTFGPSWNLTASDSVKTADEWDFLLLRASFLRSNSEIIRGELSLVINTTVKHFQIPPQTAAPQFGRHADMKLIGSTASNEFNVIVLPGP